MAIYRQVQLSFWTDNKVVDDFTPEDKFFYLYLFTNPQTNLCGCYEVSLKTMSDQTGYTKDTIERLLARFENVHGVITYSKETKEIYMFNWFKYNWTTSGRFLISLRNEIEDVKNNTFKQTLMSLFNDYLQTAITSPSLEKKPKEKELLDSIGFFDEVNIPYAYGMHTNCMDTTVTVTVNNKDNNISSLSLDNKDNNINNIIKEIIDYLNNLLGSKYTYKNKSYNSKIQARLKEGFTVDDFKTVIDKKYKDWHDNPDMAQYLTPDTLFAPSKFEKYLNQKGAIKKKTVTEQREDVISSWAQKHGLV